MLMTFNSVVFGKVWFHSMDGHAFKGESKTIPDFNINEDLDYLKSCFEKWELFKDGKLVESAEDRTNSFEISLEKFEPLDISFEECRDRIFNHLLFDVDNDDDQILNVYRTLEVTYKKKVVQDKNGYTIVDIKQ